MNSATETVTLERDPKDAFAFVANPDHLPRWAVGFCKNIRREGDRWIVDTGAGDVGLRIVADPATGCVDFHLSPAPGIESVAYSRVLRNGAGAEYVFTYFQEDHVSDAAFAASRATLRDELVVLRMLLAPCPIAPPRREAAS